MSYERWMGWGIACAVVAVLCAAASYAVPGSPLFIVSLICLVIATIMWSAEARYIRQ